MGDPRAVTAVAEFAQLVLAHLGQRVFGDDRIAAIGDERCHAADSVCAALVAGADHQLGVGAHEGHGHGDLCAVGQDLLLVLGELLDGAENIVPPPGVEPRSMVTNLVENLFHLQRAKNRLNEDGGADRPLGNAEPFLRSHKHIVPEARLEVALQFGEIEVGAAATGQQFGSVAIHIQAKVKEAAGDRLTVDQHILLDQVPATRAHQQRRHFVIQDIALAVGIVEGDSASNGIATVDLPQEGVFPRRRQRVLKVGHEDLGARI